MCTHTFSKLNATLAPALEPADMCIQLLHSCTTLPVMHRPYNHPTNIHQPSPTLVSSRAQKYFWDATCGLPCWAIWFTVCQTYLENHIFSWKKWHGKGLSVGTFGGSGLRPLPPLCEHTLGSATNGLMGVTLSSYGERGSQIPFFTFLFRCASLAPTHVR